MATGLEMMLKNVLGIDPEQMKKEMEQTIDKMLQGIQNASDRLTALEAISIENERKLAAIIEALRVPYEDHRLIHVKLIEPERKAQ
jgi:hypothetical protein